MCRGGYRRGAGRKAAWRHGETKTIRVPVALREKLLEIARQLDRGEYIYEPIHSELNSLLSEWQAKCDAEPTDSPEWQKVRQLLGEIRELLSPEAIATNPEVELETQKSNKCSRRAQSYGYGHGRRRNRDRDFQQFRSFTLTE